MHKSAHKELLIESIELRDRYEKDCFESILYSKEFISPKPRKYDNDNIYEIKEKLISAAECYE